MRGFLSFWLGDVTVNLVDGGGGRKVVTMTAVGFCSVWANCPLSSTSSTVTVSSPCSTFQCYFMFFIKTRY